MTQMNPCMKKRVSGLRRFRSDENGAATIEAVLWIPVFFFLLVLIVDASLMFHGQARALRIVQDNNRAVAVGRIATTTDAEAIIRSRLAQISPNASVSTSNNSGIIGTVVGMPATDLSSLGIVTKMGDFTIWASAEQFLED